MHTSQKKILNFTAGKKNFIRRKRIANFIDQVWKIDEAWKKIVNFAD